MKNFAIFLIGALIVAGAVAFGLHQMGVSPTWIVIVVLLIIGIGVMSGVGKTQRKE
jgi:predicted ABC-type sugar transport system permease subunit